MGVGYCRTQNKDTTAAIRQPWHKSYCTRRDSSRPLSAPVLGTCKRHVGRRETCPLIMTVPDQLPTPQLMCGIASICSSLPPPAPTPLPACPRTPCHTDHSHQSIVKIKRYSYLNSSNKAWTHNQQVLLPPSLAAGLSLSTQPGAHSKTNSVAVLPKLCHVTQPPGWASSRRPTGNFTADSGQVQGEEYPIE
jgi:hypothetical protein